MGIGVDLRERRDTLRDEISSALQFQMRQLAPHFPTGEEIEKASELHSELQNEDTDRSSVLQRKRDLLGELAYGFEEISFEGQAQVVWKGDDYLAPNIDGSELYLTQEGKLIRSFFIPKTPE